MVEFDLTELFEAAHQMQANWEREGLQFCFIGGLAVHHWGEIRMTQDVDATVLTGFGNESVVIEKLWTSLDPRIADATQFAKLNRVVLGQSQNQVPFDVSLSGLPYEEQVISRSRPRLYTDGISLRICEPSDLVVLKAFANRPRDWQDIRGVIIRSGHLLDWGLIETQLTQLAELKEEPEIVCRLDDLRRETPRK